MKRMTPIFIWLLVSLYIALHDYTTLAALWPSFVDNAIVNFPSLLIYCLVAFLLKKTSHFFMSFQEKPFLWLGLGGILLLGQLLLNDTTYLKEYLFAAFLPFLLKLLEDLDGCTLRCQFVALLIAFGILILFYNKVSMLAYGAALFLLIFFSIIFKNLHQL